MKSTRTHSSHFISAKETPSHERRAHVTHWQASGQSAYSSVDLYACVPAVIGHESAESNRRRVYTHFAKDAASIERGVVVMRRSHRHHLDIR
jgi:hypothetical protein